MGPIIWVLGLIVIISACFVMRKKRPRAKRPGRPASLLDRVLFRWTPRDPFTVRDLLSGGVIIFGRPGSGKTSSSGKTLAKSIVRMKRSGGLILSAKPGEDRAFWTDLFRREDKEQDLIIFEPNGLHRFNFLNEAMKHGGHTRNIVRLIMTISECLRQADSKGGEAEDEWQKQAERMIYNAVEVVKQAKGRVDAWELQRFITDSAPDPSFLLDEKKLPDSEKATRERILAWKKGFHCECIAQAMDKPKTPTEEHDLNLALDYWLGEVPAMADRTKSSILIGVLGTLHVFNTGIIRELCSTTTTASPDDTLRGKWVLVDMAPSEWGDIGAFVCAGWKYLTQTALLRRHATEADPIHIIWADEFQTTVNYFDAHYLNQSRSHKGAMICLTQSLHGLFAALKGHAGRVQANMLISAFQHKIFHALGDAETAEFASSLVGKKLQTFLGGSMAPTDSLWDDLMGNTKFTGSFSEHYESVLQPNKFFDLRTGGEENNLETDAYLIRSGVPFSNGELWLPVTFSQKD